MIENNNVSQSSSNRSFRKAPLAAALSLLAGGLASPAFAEVSFEADSGWKFGINGHIPVFALMSDNDNLEEDAFRITTGFNPATAQFNVYAPTQYGLDVSGHFQLNSHLSGADGVQNSGFGRDADQFGRISGVESRVAEFAVAGDFGTVNIGKGFGIFGVPAIGDNGSGLGVGLFSPNAGDATAGRIGNGYFYANFNPRVTYTSPSMSGLQFKVGLFQPEKPKDGTAVDTDVGTESPRFEANVVWSGDMVTLWSSGFSQSVSVNDPAVDDFTMTGIDLGGALSLGNLGVRANYAMTQGTGNFVVGGHGVVGGSQEEDADQWYVETTYDINRTTLGASYGEGSDDLSNEDTELTMVFARYRATDAWTVMAEIQDYASSTPNSDYNAFILGSQFTF
ncbi:MAG TPA: porin [Marinobacter sp.]|uniref:porin n=1 Tax=Marinobacter sp. TaxID=50741 RepID=UPI002605C52F|nr:porin [Marinobacter sp.]HET8800883.1 porin [Marinobacter sp.]